MMLSVSFELRTGSESDCWWQRTEQGRASRQASLKSRRHRQPHSLHAPGRSGGRIGSKARSRFHIGSHRWTESTPPSSLFHVARLANSALDECRRRVQNETVGHRGRKHDPLYQARRRLVMARERLSDDGHERLLGLLRAGDPRREVWFAWNAKEVVRQIYDHNDHLLAQAWVDEIVRDFADTEMPPEVRRLGRTIARWRHQIVAWHRSHVSNGPTEAVNNLVKRVKRVAFGMRNFAHYRVRSLLYAGKPNWNLLDSLTPP